MFQAGRKQFAAGESAIRQHFEIPGGGSYVSPPPQRATYPHRMRGVYRQYDLELLGWCTIPQERPIRDVRPKNA